MPRNSRKDSNRIFLPKMPDEEGDEMVVRALGSSSKRQAAPSQRSFQRSADIGPHGKVLYKPQVPNLACFTLVTRLQRGQNGWRRGASHRTPAACRRMARALLAAAALLAALSLSHAAEVPLRFGIIMRTGDAPGESTPFGQLLAADGSPVTLQDVEAVGFGPVSNLWSASRGRAVLCGMLQAVLHSGKAAAEGGWGDEGTAHCLQGTVSKDVDISSNPDFSSLHQVLRSLHPLKCAAACQRCRPCVWQRYRCCCAAAGAALQGCASQRRHHSSSSSGMRPSARACANSPFWTACRLLMASSTSSPSSSPPCPPPSTLWSWSRTRWVIRGVRGVQRVLCGVSRLYWWHA